MLNVVLGIAPTPDLDPEAVERLVRQLRAEIAELDVVSIRPGPTGPAPEGAKGADPATLGAIVVALSASGGVFSALIDLLRDWLGRSSVQHRISVTLDGDTIELERASADERQELIDAFVRRHTGR
ncbi:effector-associated constant component EACC1 [Streptomyces roseoverticillatus]|uniref:Uncharacterized protein n=1 Tax=Streptomyces roseoverticillatus TaxID=66429 RepID=A0ABV3INE3_9ACTN